jgi:hypothetical protein
MRTPQTHSSGLITIRFWPGTNEQLAILTAYHIQRDKVKRWSMVDVLESQIERIYQAYSNGYKLQHHEFTGPRNQTTMRITQQAWEHLLAIQAHVLLQTRKSITIAQLVHNIVMDGLEKFGHS